MSEAADFSRLGRGTWTVEQGMEVDARVRAERLEIARELHDVVASGFSMVSLQAAAGAHTLAAGHPEGTLESLAQIRRVSSEALRELRKILVILRAAESNALDGAPGTARIGALVTMATDAGLPTRLTVSGMRRLLPADVDLAAYRIVQESITNALRHADAASASVLIVYHDDRVVVEVEDDGVGGAAASTPSFGILGMRERASALGGELDVGPRPEGGFRVRATLPLRAAR
jgi:signal transduction histidine kinase